MDMKIFPAIEEAFLVPQVSMILLMGSDIYPKLGERVRPGAPFDPYPDEGHMDKAFRFESISRPAMFHASNHGG